jgi:Na+(H+)/acetate symporter ActP
MDKKTSAFGLARMVSPDDYLDCSPRSGWFTGYVGICHLFAAYLSKLGAKGKKKELHEHPKNF